jgi:hypothetical protein
VYVTSPFKDGKIAFLKCVAVAAHENGTISTNELYEHVSIFLYKPLEFIVLKLSCAANSDVNVHVST